MSLTSPPATPSTAAAIASGPTTRRLHGCGGIALAVDVHGDPAAPAVMLLHGGGQTRHAWRGTAERLAAAGFHALNVDLRGHGESEWAPDGDYEMRRFAADIREIAATLPGPPALVGASLGGLASLTCQFLHPLAWALVLVDITPRMDPEGVLRIVGFMTAHPEGFASIEEAADAIAAYLPHRPRPADNAGLAKNLRLGEDGRWRWHWDPRFLSGPPRSTSGDHARRLHEAAMSLKVPALLVRGRMSEIVSEEGVREFLEAVPHAEYVDIEDAAHMVAGDRNDVFCDAVVDFLRRSVPGREADRA